MIRKPLISLFTQFIRDTETGRRLKKNGERIRPDSIQNYKYVLLNLTRFSESTGFDLRIRDTSRLNKRELLVEKNYWKKFYRGFTDYLYKNGCHDNYVGANIKTIRVFFNYLKTEKHIHTGDFHKQFYVRKEEIEIQVLSPDQLKFLIHDKSFEEKLTDRQRKVKDIFVFGCTTGLRFSDLFLLTKHNFEHTDGKWYLKVKSKKTKAFTKVRLPEYAVRIFEQWSASNNKRATVFGQLSLFNFNKTLKEIGEAAGFTDPVDVSREKLGKAVKMASSANTPIRFCDKMSSHMMRRTAITTMLILGMPDHLVRKVSGHTQGGNSFNRYVHHAQAYMDTEIEKLHGKLETI
ncbi:tyrosine-type recombinase/integrase [Flavobacterium sp. MAH-1]|uniref:Tyrosine-type recombinase/integrase n=1 Tax=Flavobacterium agri TaxID=2743471 RepID=A0A7Y8Y7X2_9FLAO|nr:tyrosine-type recombinase/integrase [Flavobacterium agri]NUY82717.1 tyrosine-type recombinase/integrase [Flavobacterium agri]NYA72740.1 tyrosine-type recombinase/integrase [Flavobacterium agri]